MSILFGHFVDFQDQNMMASDSIFSQKSTFPKIKIYISIEK